MTTTISNDSEKQDSIDLILRYQAGDRLALDALCSRYYERVRRMVALRVGHLLRDIAEIDDVVQETFLSAMRAIDRFELREEGRLVNWLACIAERKVLDMLQHANRPKRERGRAVSLEDLRQAGAASSSVGWDPPGDATQAPDRAERNELAVLLDRCLAKLDARHREVILLRDFAGGTWKYVAEELGCVSAEAARKLYSRARVALVVLMQNLVQRPHPAE
jgi:RNA polymerase sigma-70 factor (ECF subfamily)